MEELEQPFRALGIILLPHVVGSGGEFQMLSHRQFLIEQRRFWNKSQRRLVSLRLLNPCLALNHDTAPMRCHQPQYMLHRRTLARAVQTNETDHFSQLYIKLNIMKHRTTEAIAPA
ncbi:hypothetical protein D3C77_450480 [compost metagenome]